MTDIWYVSAELMHVGDRRIIIYKMDEAQERARLNVEDILLILEDSYGELFEQLKSKNADEMDIKFVQKERELLRETAGRWKTECKTW